MDSMSGKESSMDPKQLEELIKGVVSEVVASKSKAAKPKVSQANGDRYLGVFDTMDEAVAAAKTAQKDLHAMPLEFREKIITRLREKIRENKEVLAKLAHQETGMGRVGDKILKHELVAAKTPGTESIQVEAWSGDQGLTLVEKGPFGVVGAVTPSTNPSETVLCNGIGMIAAGNTVVFNPHPQATQTANLAVHLINEASVEVGGINNLATSIAKPTIETGNQLFKHPDIQLLVATGGPGVVKAILQSGKRGIAAGAGNPPVLVDETADIEKAAQDIINGATFDNNLPCISEKEVVAVDCIADELIKAMINKNNCYYIEGAELEALTNTVIVENKGRKMLNRDCVGRDAHVLLAMIDVKVSPNIRAIIFEGSKDHPLIKEELMMPILGVTRVRNVDEGIKVSKELEQGNRHSAHMHSTNLRNLTKFGKELDTAIYVKNAPSYAGIGFGGEGFTTFTIASRTGEGLTYAQTFTKSRRCVLAEDFFIR